jgi:hypothetical protein
MNIKSNVGCFLGEALAGPCFVLVFPLFVIALFWPSPHEQPQPCPHCGRKSRHVGETVLEGQGRRSWTDLIIAEYHCKRCQSMFTKEWTGACGFD